MRTIVLLLVAVALVAAGCGGGSGSSSSKPLTKAQYQAKLEEIAKEVSTQISSSSSDFNKLTDKDLSQLTDVLHSFTAKLSGVTPPDEVKDLHTQLIAAINAFADEFPVIARKLKTTKDPSEAIALLFGAKSVQDLAKLQQSFKAKGYDLKLSG
jgi:hypothetical protein